MLTRPGAPSSPSYTITLGPTRRDQEMIDRNRLNATLELGKLEGSNARALGIVFCAIYHSSISTFLPHQTRQ